MVASEDCAEKGGASYGHYAQALEKVKRDMRRYIYEVTTIKSKLKHIRLSDELTNQYDLVENLLVELHIYTLCECSRIVMYCFC